MKNTIMNKMKELLQIGMFFIVLFGGATLLAFIYSHINGRDAISIGFLNQTVIYAAVLSVWIAASFTEIVPLKMDFKIKLVINCVILYILTLFFFRNTMINPFQGIDYFIILTLWYLFMIGIGAVAWLVYQSIISATYSKYLARYQKSNRC